MLSLLMMCLHKNGALELLKIRKSFPVVACGVGNNPP